MIAGPAPIVDLDGTLVNLDVDWSRLRRSLGLDSIDDLWSKPNSDWSQITRAELRGAVSGEPIEPVIEVLRKVRGFAVLTSNHESAVAGFLARFPDLEVKLLAVAGRDTMGGPKRSLEFFARGFAVCDQATRPLRESEPPTFVGDSPYELAYAQELGAIAVHVSEVVRKYGEHASERH